MKHIVVALLIVVGCGKQDEAPAPAVDKASVTADKPVDTPVERSADTPAAPKAAEPKPADTSRGACHIVGSGAVTFDQTTPHTGPSSLAIMQWHDAAMRQKMGYPDEGMILNCLGPNIRLNVLTATGTPFPMKPATYQVGGKGAAIKVLGSMKLPDKEVSILKAEGTLEITAFDAKHIAGKGEINIQSTVPVSGKTTLAIDFDMQCDGLSGCAR